MYILVRHKVTDFAKWKPVYDAHLSARQKAGLREEHLFRNADDPNEVLLLFSALRRRIVNAVHTTLLPIHGVMMEMPFEEKRTSSFRY